MKVMYWTDALSQAEQQLRQSYLGANPLLVPVQTWSGASACSQLKTYMSIVERLLMRVCSRHSRAYWFMLLRRLRPDSLFSFDQRQTAINTQATAELAAIKFGNPGRFDIMRPDRSTLVSESDELPDLQALLRHATLGSLYPRIDDEDFFDFVALCRFSREHYRLTGAYRWIGKGATLLVRNGWDIDISADDDVNALVSLYDDRLERSQSDLMSHMGLSYPLSMRDLFARRDRDMVLMLMGVGQAPHRYAERFVELSRDYPIGISLKDFRYLISFIDLERIGDLVSFAKDDFVSTYHLDWDVFCAFWYGMSRYLLLQLHGPEMALKLSQWHQRGYIIGPRQNLVQQVFVEAAQSWYREKNPELSVSMDEWQQYIEKFVSIICPEAHELDLHTLWPTPVLANAGDLVIIDLAKTGQLLGEILNIQVSDKSKNARADRAEALVEERLTSQTKLQPYLPRKKVFRLAGRRIGEADLSFRCGSVLIVVDVKSYAVTAGFQRGEYNAVRTRWGYVQEWVDQADRLSKNLGLNPKGDNYDLVGDGITHVLAVVCSLFHEYVGSRDRRYFLTSRIPRVALPAELELFFERKTESSLKNHPCAVRLTTTKK